MEQEPNDNDRKPNKLGLSLLVAGLFSTFVTAIFILMSAVPAIAQGQDAPGLLGQAILVWIFITGIGAYLMQGWQNALEELNKPRDHDKKDGDEDKRDNIPPM